MNTRTEMKKNKSPAAAERIRKNRTLRIAVSFALLFCLLLSSACSVAEYSFSADADAQVISQLAKTNVNELTDAECRELLLDLTAMLH